MALKWCHGTVTDRQVWTDGLFTIKVEVDGIDPFVPGQFLQVGMHLQNGETREHVFRPYSVASPWGPTLEFFIVVVPEGRLTPQLWDLKSGDPIDVSARAAGRFTLRHTPPADHLWLVATGTGLAPYIAMLRTGDPWQQYRKIVVVHGVRHGTDLAYADELRKFSHDRAGQLVYIPTVTREEVDGALTGRIPNLLENGSLEAEAKIELVPETTAIMLCGNPAMLDDMEALLEKRGVHRHRSKTPGHLVLERYW